MPSFAPCRSMQHKSKQVSHKKVYLNLKHCSSVLGALTDKESFHFSTGPLAKIPTRNKLMWSDQVSIRGYHTQRHVHHSDQTRATFVFWKNFPCWNAGKVPQNAAKCTLDIETARLLTVLLHGCLCTTESYFYSLPPPSLGSAFLQGIWS